MEDILQIALKAVQNGQSCAFATIVEATPKGTPRKSGAKMVVLSDGTTFGTIGGGRNEKAAQVECLKAISTGKPTCITYDYFGKEGQSICGGQTKVFIEPFIGKKHLIICGAGHIALPLSALGKILNFKVTIVDDRKNYANKTRFPHVDGIFVGSHAKSLKKIKIDESCFITIVTQGNEYDYECLKVAIKTNAAYIGVISSQAKRVKFFRRLKESGTASAEIRKVHAPMGLNIGAQTPEEIAISIMSEIIAKNTNSLGSTLRFQHS